MTKWPALLRKLVQSHGEDAVWQVGLQTLGYPPTWATSAHEHQLVAHALAGTARPNR